MANGKYATDITNLDISVGTKDCTFTMNNGYMSCPEYSCVVYDGGGEENVAKAGLAYCLLWDQGLYYFTTASNRYCGATVGKKRAKQVCLSLGGAYHNTQNGVDYYLL